MDARKMTSEQIAIARQWSSDLVDRVAPEEAPFFDTYFEEYAKAISSEGHGEWGAPGNQGIGFSEPMTWQDYVTPQLVATVVAAVMKVAEVAAQRVKGKDDPKDVDIEDLVNFDGIKRELFEILRGYRIGEKRANQIVNEFVARIVIDANVVLKATQ